MLIKQPRFSVWLRRKQLTEWPGKGLFVVVATCINL